MSMRRLIHPIGELAPSRATIAHDFGFKIRSPRSAAYGSQGGCSRFAKTDHSINERRAV